jgi:hypothetical protein
MPGIRTVFIHNITSPKFRAPVFSKSNRAARWVAHIGYNTFDGVPTDFKSSSIALPMAISSSTMDIRFFFKGAPCGCNAAYRCILKKIVW